MIEFLISATDTDKACCKSAISGKKLTDLAVCTFEPRLAFAHILIKNVSSSGVSDHLTRAIVFTWVWVTRTCGGKQEMFVSQYGQTHRKRIIVMF